VKVSVNWIRDINNKYHCSADPMPDGIDTLVEKIGAQLGAVEEVIDLGKKYQGIVVAKVVKCEKHPNADKLSVCLIDDGKTVKNVKRNKDRLVEVVCGAPNVAAGQLVAWIPPGVTVPSTEDKESFVLEAREIRGVVSNGMIASAKELALGDDHSGIVVIDEPAKPGQPFAEVYGLNDYIIDIENKMFTHRPDLFGMLGIARELAGIQNQVFKSPGWYKEKVEVPKPRGNGLKLTIKNQLPQLVPRFMAVAIRDIEVRPSPVRLQAYLSRIGIRPINNIVDLTNFFMMETAQPLHAYDYDKLSAGSIETRLAKAGEELVVLGGKKIKLHKEDIVIASGGKAIGLGGVMGGAGTEVDASTKNIVIEVANFGMNSIRRTAMTHGLFTDAATRFTKNQSPRQNLAVMAKAMADIMSMAGGRQASALVDDKHFKQVEQKVRVTVDFINARLGEQLTLVQIKKLMENVEFKVEISGETLKIEAPFWRTDIEIPEDVVEEVGRLYGYDHLPLELPSRNLTPAELNRSLAFKQQISEILSAAGANEVLNYSFVHGSLIEKAGQDIALAFHIKNALSPDLQYYRPSLAPSLLEKVHPNIKAGFDSFCLFEIGRAHVRGILDKGKLPAELDRLAFVFADKRADKSRGASYYQAKHYVLFLADRLGVGEFISVPLSEADLAPEWRQVAKAYAPARSAAIFSDQTFLGLVGEPSSSLRTGLKLPSYTAQAELDLVALATVSMGSVYEPLNRYPSLEQDITLKVPAELTYAEIVDFVSNFLDKLSQPAGYQGSVGPLDIFQSSTDKTHKNVTLRIVMTHPGRTLTTQEVNKLLDELAAEAKTSLKADRI
jgi:phenylalanyl-tRNA synthetase beta chain